MFISLRPQIPEDAIDQNPVPKVRNVPTKQNLQPWRELPFRELRSASDIALYVQISPPEYRKNSLTAIISRTLRLQPPEPWRRSTAALSGPCYPILSLPIDILIEIFSRLHPLDLYRLCETCTQFRRFLLDPALTNYRLTWRRSFDRYPDVPIHPSGMGILRWMSFLFGPAVCQHCGKGGAQLCFGVTRRYCGTCMQKFLMTKPDVKALCKAHDPSHMVNQEKALSMCHRVFRIAIHHEGVRTAGEEINRREDGEDEEQVVQLFYLREEVEKNILIACTECQRQRNPLTHNKLLRKLGRDIGEKVGRKNKIAAHAYQWAIQVKNGEWERQIAWYMRKCYYEGKKLGYEPSDWRQQRTWEYVRPYYEDWEIPGLRRRDFKYHFSNLLPIVAEIKAERQREESESTYKKYYNSLLPKETLQFPFRIFSDVDSKEASKTAIFPDAALDWHKTTRNERLQQLVETHLPLFRSIPRRLVLEASGDSPLELAAAIFSCTRCLTRHHIGAALVGWDAIAQHMCANIDSLGALLHLPMHFSNEAHATALLLIDSLGLDARATTVKDMDSVDARWFCGNCEKRRADGIGFRGALKWRECLTHSTYCVDRNTHATPNWLLLSERITRFVKCREALYPSPDKDIWGCAHCRVHVEWSTSYPKAEQHVKAIHKVRSPQNGRDIILLMNRYASHGRGPKEHAARRPVLYQTNPPLKYHCLRCPYIPHGKYWTGTEIFKHLRERHHIPDIEQGRDWETFDIHHGSV